MNMIQIGKFSQRIYITALLDIVARCLVSASKVDPDVKRDAAGFPVGFVIQMVVLPNGPGFFLEVQSDHSFKKIKHYDKKPDLALRIKHMSLAFLILTFQENTAKAFANERIVADGELSKAIRFVRCLEQVESLILPKLVAEYAVKSYPSDITFSGKIKTAGTIYSHVVQSYLVRN